MNGAGDEKKQQAREHADEASHENETNPHQDIPHLNGEEDSADINAGNLKGKTHPLIQ